MALPIGAKVRLKYNFGDVYQKAWGGSIGYVRDVKVDEYGFERCFIDWDIEDWRYNNMSPGWTYSSHFDILEMPKEDQPKRKPKSKEELPSNIEEIDAFMAELQKGIEAASGSEGFVVFVAKRVPVPEGEGQMIVPEIYAASHSTEADAVLGLTIQEHLTTVFQEMSMLLLEMFQDGDDDESLDL